MINNKIFKAAMAFILLMGISFVGCNKDDSNEITKDQEQTEQEQEQEQEQ